MLSPILALFARISKPLWLNIHSTRAEVVGGQKTFSSNGCSTLNVSLCATSTQVSESHVSISRFTSDEDRVSMVPSPKTKTETDTRGFQDQDQDQDSEVQDQDQDSEVSRARPRLRGSRPRPRLLRFQDQDQDQDSEVRQRPRPRPRLVKTGLETSRDQDSSLENSKSAICLYIYLS